MTRRVEFHEEPGDRTRLIIRQGPFPDEVADMARKGWLTSFLKLDRLLAS